MTELEQIPKHIKNYFATRKNKRYGRDAAEYEVDWVSNMVKAIYQRDNRTFAIHRNYAFLVSYPKWREIFATDFNGRMADHELCDRLMPFIETELSPRTFNNRKGKGQKAAIDQVVKDIYDVTEGYTKQARVIKFDLKGFFPNALRSHIQSCFNRVIDKYIQDVEERTYLHWLTEVCVMSNPAKYCELRTPKILWKYIDPEKSLFQKPDNIGIPIGRLTSQIGMGLYVNDIIKWLTDECNLKISMFMDDCVIVVEEDRHQFALQLFHTIRQRFNEVGIRMNEKKFYDQPYQHGLEFLGVHIKPMRLHTNQKIYNKAKFRIQQLNRVPNKYASIDKFMQSVNSYTGMLKTKSDFNKVCILKRKIANGWWRILFWSNKKLCVQYFDKYSFNNRLRNK